ncbi:MAG: ribosome silencing factor [Acidobacteriota bacterium]
MTDSNDRVSGADATDDQVRIAVTAALDRKAEHLTVLDIHAISDFTERFLICNGSNERQVQAIADSVIKKMRDAGLRPLHVEGLRHGRWVLLDYGGDMVIHIFLDDAREFYALERLWSDAPDITARFVQ